MKFIELELSPFGHFEQHKLDFSDPSKSFHLIYGANEAGKSTTLRAIEGFLFGIPKNSRDGFQYDNALLRINAVLESTTLGSRTLVRRKGNKNTLLDADGRPVDDELITSALGGLDRSVFSKMYGLNHDALIEGAKGLLAGGGNLGETLFQAGTGVAALRPRLAKLEEEAKRQFSPSANNQSSFFNKAKHLYTGAQATMRESAIAPRKYVELENELRKKSLLAEGLRHKINDEAKLKSRLERLSSLQPHYARRLAILVELDTLAHVPKLSEEAPAVRRRAIESLDAAQRRREILDGELLNLQERIQAIDVSQDLIDKSGLVADWCDGRAKIAAAADDLPSIQRERVDFEESARRILRQMGSPASLESVEQMRPTDSQRLTIEELIEDNRRLMQEGSELRREVEQLQREQRKLDDALSALPEAAVSADLRLAITSAMLDPQLDRRMSDIIDDIGRLEESVAIKARRLPLWEGPAQDLEALAVPSVETIDRFDQLTFRHESESKAVTDRLCECRENLSRENVRLEQLLVDGEIATLHNLTEARRVRDAGWRLVREAWKLSDGIDKTVPEYDPSRSLAEAFELNVKNADEIGDVLREDATRIAEHASQVRKIAECESALILAEEASNSLQQRRHDVEAEWLTLWRRIGIDPLPPKEMRAWMISRADIALDTSNIREARRQLTALTEKRSEFIVGLSEGLISVGEILPPAAQARLSSALDYSNSVLVRSEESGRMRQQILRDQVKVNYRLRELHDDSTRWNEMYESWKGRWSAATTVIGLPSDASPQQAQGALNRLVELFNFVDRASDHRRRELGIKRDSDLFHTRGVEILTVVAPDLLSISDLDAARQLAARLSKMQTNKATRDTLGEQIQQKNEELRRIRIEIEHAESSLRRLLNDAGCQTIADLEEVERAASKVRELKSEADRETSYLLESAGSSLEKLLQELDSMDPDRIASEITEIATSIEAQQEEYGTLLQEVGALADQLKAMDGKEVAAEAALTAQDALAKMNTAAERYIRVRLSALLLRRYIDEYQRTNQGPVLEAASVIFSGLTLGKFERLRTDFDDRDDAILLGVRDNGRDVPIEGMSDGTRDALYLALRLASLKHYFTTHEPVPFIVDDILINLDDSRATAALKALSDLSELTQVLLFTHHHHLLRLAEETVPRPKLSVHRI